MVRDLSYILFLITPDSAIVKSKFGLVIICGLLSLSFSCDSNKSKSESSTIDSAEVKKTSAIVNDNEKTNSTEIINDWLLIPGKRAGSISYEDSENVLIKKFGKENIRTTQEYFEYGEPQQQYVTRIFPESNNEIFVYWGDDTLRREASRISVFFNAITGKRSKWHLAEGVKIGSSLEELEHLANSEILFEGFTAYETRGSVLLSSLEKLHKSNGSQMLEIRLENIGDMEEQGIFENMGYAETGCSETVDLMSERVSSKNVKCKKKIAVSSITLSKK